MSSDAFGTRPAQPSDTPQDVVAQHLALRTSRRHRHIVWSGHFLAAGALLIADLSWWRLPLLGGVMLSCWWEWRQIGSLRALERFEDGRWRLHDAQGGAHEARLLPDCFVHPRLTILRFAPERGASRSVVLFPDSVDADDARRLRVWLRGRAGTVRRGIIERWRRRVGPDV